jgi:hypothetical protein
MDEMVVNEDKQLDQHHVILCDLSRGQGALKQPLEVRVRVELLTAVDHRDQKLLMLDADEMQ